MSLVCSRFNPIPRVERKTVDSLVIGDKYWVSWIGTIILLCAAPLASFSIEDKSIRVRYGTVNAEELALWGEHVDYWRPY